MTLEEGCQQKLGSLKVDRQMLNGIAAWRKLPVQWGKL